MTRQETYGSKQGQTLTILSGPPPVSEVHSPNLKLPSASEKPGTVLQSLRDLSPSATLGRQLPKSERVSPKVLIKTHGS